MDRPTARRLAVALLVVLAVGVAAATLTSTLSAGDDLSSGGRGEGTGDGRGDGSDSEPRGEAGRPVGGGPDLCIPFVETLQFRLGLLLVFIAIAAPVYWRTNRVVGTAMMVPVGLLFVAFYGIMLAMCGVDIRRRAINATNTSLRRFANQSRGASGGGGSPEYVASNPWLVAAIAVAAVLLVGGLLYLRTEDDFSVRGLVAPAAEEDPEERADQRALSMLGETAGRAADRIQDEGEAGVGNEVYRAWKEMTDHLEMDNPETSTPGEFASEAYAVGMDDEHVRELTRLFEDVRYGHSEPTAEREQRAVSALRAIEESYADGGDES